MRDVIPVDDHCGEHLSLRKKDISYFNESIAPNALTKLLEDESLRERLGKPAREKIRTEFTSDCQML